jgi:hypothetical protein
LSCLEAGAAKHYLLGRADRFLVRQEGVMAKKTGDLTTLSSKAEVDVFLDTVARAPALKPAGRRGRLMFAMDATASRQASWDRAIHLQAEMFESTKTLGGLDIQLAHYRGFREFEASRWIDNADSLVERMTAVSCRGGQTQIGRVLRHALKEGRREPFDALVFVGDCFEEGIDSVCETAGRLGLLGLPVFVFHEGGEPIAARAFREIARLTKGAYCSFDATSAQQLKDLLGAVAVYAAGGRRALEDFGRKRGGGALQITSQMR